MQPLRSKLSDCLNEKDRYEIPGAKCWTLVTEKMKNMNPGSDLRFHRLDFGFVSWNVRTGLVRPAGFNGGLSQCTIKEELSEQLLLLHWSP